jgi:hypothetical protein
MFSFFSLDHVPALRLRRTETHTNAAPVRCLALPDVDPSELEESPPTIPCRHWHDIDELHDDRAIAPNAPVT